jgi:two-component system sensor histidine kinase KdpD
MSVEDDFRPDPEALLNAIRKEEQSAVKGKLKIFFGMCAGVGKTYDMLKSAHEALANGTDVVVGIVEGHGRPETEALKKDLPIIPRKRIEYRDSIIEEMDLDAIIARHPAIVLVDELAHTNAPGSRHLKRYQDVLELLENGITVYTTVNVQHLESRADTVAQITGSLQRETVPDSIFAQADEVELIDIPPDELVKRLEEGKVYTPERSREAVRNFFRIGNLTALREMSLRLTAERVDHQLRSYLQTQRISQPWKSVQRFLVCMSASPHSISLIRSARRMAYTMDATWMVLYVESSSPLAEEAKAQLAKNLKLARELGAEIVTSADDDVAAAVVRVAQRQNATQILVGKSVNAIPFGKSLAERIMERSGNLDVYVLGASGTEETTSSIWRVPSLQSGVTQYFAAAGAVVFVSLICYALSPYLAYQTVSMILLLTIALLPLRLGAGPVLLAAGLSGLLWDYLFIPPRFTFVVAQPQDILMLVTYFAIAAVTGTLTARIRARERAVRQREERTSALYQLTRELSAASSQDNVAKAAVTNIKKFFDAEVAIFLSEPDGDIFTKANDASTYLVGEKEFSVPAWVYWNEKKAGKFSDTLPFAGATYYPISGPRYPLGVIGVKLPEDIQPSIELEILLQNFISQIAAALEREQLNEMAKKSIAVVESERLYKTLFNSLSHELRTPIAAIVSASEGLQQSLVNAGKDSEKGFSHEIKIAADRLNRLVENLLDMTRLESGRISPSLDWCDLHDLFNAALHKLERELSQHNVLIDIPADFPLVKLDFGLMEQAITNLLHNESLYTPPGTQIEVHAYIDGRECFVTVADNGPGFPRESLPHLFEKFYRVPGSTTGGTGLGLSIVRGFIEAHGGTIRAETRASGGAQFIIVIPFEAAKGAPQEKQV